jgi:hypothetical protein
MLREPIMNEDGELRQRLARVEQEMCRWKLVAALAGTGLAVITLTGQAAPRSPAKVVETERVVLRDAHGKTLAVLGAQSDQSGRSVPSLTLYDSFGRGRIRLSVGLDAPRLHPRASRSRAPTLAREEAVDAQIASVLGTPAVTLYDREGQARAMIGDTGLALADAAGALRATLTDELGVPALTLYDGSEAERAKLGLGAMHIINDADTALATVSPTLVGLMAEDGRVAALTKPQARSLWLEFRDHSGTRRLALGMRPEGAPSLLVDDKDVKLSP